MPRPLLKKQRKRKKRKTVRVSRVSALCSAEHPEAIELAPSGAVVGDRTIRGDASMSLRTAGAARVRRRESIFARALKWATRICIEKIGRAHV